MGAPPINPLMHHFLGITQHPQGQSGFDGDPTSAPFPGQSRPASGFGSPVFGASPSSTPPPTFPTRPTSRPMPPLGPQRSTLR